jgi:lysophospholipase L1-like esterase
MRRVEVLSLIAAAAIGPRIVVLGDSLALGTGSERADGGFIFRAYRTLLARRPGSRLDAFAIGGSTVADVVRLQLPRLVGARYDVAIVCAGGNDVVRHTPVSDFRRSYATLVDGIRRRTPAIRIVCCGIPDVSVSPLFSDERGLIRSLAAGDDRAIRTIAAASGCSFVDLFDASRKMTDFARYLARDHFHPSDAGYALLEQPLTRVLNQLAL